MSIPGKGKNRGDFRDISEMSFRQRSQSHDRKRKQQVRRQWMIIAVVAIVAIVIIVIACKHFVGKKSSPKQENKQVEQQQQKQKVVASATPSPTPEPEGSDRWLRKDLDPEKPMVALTFDDGPYTPVTSQILDTLEENDGVATFFCVGNRVAQYSEMVQRAYDQGCEIASHTYTHTYLSGLSAAGIRREQNKTNAAIKKIIGCKPTALRPPGGFVNDTVRKNVRVPMYLWSVDSEDWKSRNSHKVLVKTKNIEDGDVVLMHDLYPTTADAVKKLVPRLAKKGFQFVTVDEMFYYKNIKVKAGEVHFSGK